MHKNFIQEYVESKLDGQISGNGREFVCASIFTIDYDYKKHMSVNVDTGLWQCFKSKEKGNFVDLYATIEGISKKAAYGKIMFKRLERGEIWETEDVAPSGVLQGSLDTTHFEPITENSDVEDPLIAKALSYLYRRSLFPKEDGEYYVAREGRYKGRLIIPYKDQYGEIYYHQARALGDEHPKYLNPGRDEGVKSSNVLYPFPTVPYPEHTFLYVTEGPLDAKSLQRCGLNATCTNGSHVSRIQAEQLKESGFKIVMAYDKDEAGREGAQKFLKNKRYHQIEEIYNVVPQADRDWETGLF